MVIKCGSLSGSVEVGLSFLFWCSATTLESGIDVGQGITVGSGKFIKKKKTYAIE